MVVPPFHTPKRSFLVGKPAVVGYHHFRKTPYWITPTKSICFLIFGFAPPKNASCQKLIHQASTPPPPPGGDPTNKRVPYPTGDGSQDHPTLGVGKSGLHNFLGQIVNRIHSMKPSRQSKLLALKVLHFTHTPKAYSINCRN